MPKLRAPRHATVVAYLALFVALGGTSVAAASLTGRDVRDNTLSSRDVRNNSLSSRDLRDNSVTSRDVRSLRRRDFVRGALAPNSQIVTANATVASNGNQFGTVKCPSGTTVSGGGYVNVIPGTVVDSFAITENVWGVQVVNGQPGSTFKVTAVCLS